VDTGLDKANDLVSEKTGGQYDQHIDTAEEKLEGFLGVDPRNGNE
jgi:hypothetical protein